MKNAKIPVVYAIIVPKAIRESMLKYKLIKPLIPDLIVCQPNKKITGNPIIKIITEVISPRGIMSKNLYNIINIAIGTANIHEPQSLLFQRRISCPSSDSSV